MLSLSRCFFVVFVFLFAIPGSAWGDEKWKERLIVEGPKSWDALASLGLKGSLIRTRNRPDGKTFDLNTLQSEFLISGPWVKIETRYRKTLGEKLVEEKTTAGGVNSHYVFILEKTKPAESSSYRLKILGKPSEEFNLTLNSLPYIRAPWQFLGRPLKDWLKLPAFSILDVVPVRVGSKEFVQLTCKHETLDEKNAWASPFRAAIVLDPVNYWCIQEYQVTYQGLIETWRLEYGENINGFPIVRRITVELAEKVGDPFPNAETCDFDKVVRRQCSESEFSLSAFGLPEPVGVVWPKPPRWYLWLALAAFVSLAIALSFRTLKRRFQSAEPVKN